MNNKLPGQKVKMWWVPKSVPVLLWIILVSVGLSVPCTADSCNSTTLDCPKTVREPRKMTKSIPSTCYKSYRTCWGLDFFGIDCKYEQRSFGCTKSSIYYETIEKNKPGCCSGYFEESGCCIKGQCDRGFWGENCTKECSCEKDSYERCSTNGTCVCKPGWIGSECDEQCVPGTYGKDCQWNCSCENNATCNHVTGECNCTAIAGWTGERCDVECPPGSYGSNCSGSCDCKYDNQECDKVTGECRCLPGKTGSDCSADCSMDSFTFGPNCTESCRCIHQNSVRCDPVNGNCVCKPGWKGDQCQKSCDPARYGEGCLRNCTCDETEICDSVNGTCLLADVCFAEYTSNCIPRKNVSCAQFLEGCVNFSNTERKNSFVRSVLDICCNKKSLQTLCIAIGECKCLTGYSGQRCQDTTIEQQVSEQTVSVVLPVGVLVVVLVIVVALVTALVIRKKQRSLSKTGNRYSSNKAYGERSFQTVEGTSDIPLNELNLSRHENPDVSEEYDVVNRQGQRLKEEQSEMYSSNRHDINDYEYDISRQNEMKEDNYSPAIGGDTYSHLGGDSVYKRTQQLQIDDTYSHAQLTEEDGNKVSGHATLLDDYDHTDIQCQLYSNTGLHKHGESANDIY